MTYWLSPETLVDELLRSLKAVSDVFSVRYRWEGAAALHLLDVTWPLRGPFPQTRGQGSCHRLLVGTYKIKTNFLPYKKTAQPRADYDTHTPMDIQNSRLWGYFGAALFKILCLRFENPLTCAWGCLLLMCWEFYCPCSFFSITCSTFPRLQTHCVQILSFYKQKARLVQEFQILINVNGFPVRR